MSRIGQKPVHLPEGVKVQIENDLVSIVGPKGTLTTPNPRKITVKEEDGKIIVGRKDDVPTSKALHGLIRSLIKNAVDGVTSGFQKELELVGTGYRVSTHPEGISLTLGFSHPVVFKKIKGVELKLEGNNKIFISGIDKQLVGQVAADIRNLRPPEPYKGKGIRYVDEVVRRKAGKAAKAAE